MLLLRVPMLALMVAGALGSDVNWGKKVPCFVEQGSVICPGCNYRAGLSCPRALKNSPSCQATTTEESVTEAPEYQEKITFMGQDQHPEKTPFAEQETEPEETPFFQTSTPFWNDTSLVTYTSLSSAGTAAPTTQKPREAKDLVYFLYKYLKEQNARRSRWNRRARDAKDERNTVHLGEVCDWNADCPCPQICCKTGTGCPKRCVMGIRLPPPWGK